MTKEKETTELTGKTVENGFVCIFDILGYKNILENNNIERCAQIIDNILIKLPEKVELELLSAPKKIKLSHGSVSEKQHWEAVKKLVADRISFFDTRLNVIMVSDSIVLFFDFTEDNNLINHTWLTISYISIFQREAFIHGLPMRGCLDFGEYYYNNNIFAGKTIVNSYNYGSNLEFSGVVITEDAYKQIELISLNEEFYKKFISYCIFKYLVPLKNKKDKLAYIIGWYEECDFPENQDIRQFIYDAFYAYNKNIDTATVVKINNTEKILRFFVYKGRLL
jgi:hypothetical protein